MVLTIKDQMLEPAMLSTSSEALLLLQTNLEAVGASRLYSRLLSGIMLTAARLKIAPLIGGSASTEAALAYVQALFATASHAGIAAASWSSINDLVSLVDKAVEKAQLNPGIPTGLLISEMDQVPFELLLLPFLRTQPLLVSRIPNELNYCFTAQAVTSVLPSRAGLHSYCMLIDTEVWFSSLKISGLTQLSFGQLTLEVSAPFEERKRIASFQNTLKVLEEYNIQLPVRLREVCASVCSELSRLGFPEDDCVAAVLACWILPELLQRGVSEKELQELISTLDTDKYHELLNTIIGDAK